MSAWDWTECPRGCHADDDKKNFKTVRIDFEWTFDETGAWVLMIFECQICGLKCKLEQKKAPKMVIKEIEFDPPDEEYRRR